MQTCTTHLGNSFKLGSEDLAVSTPWSVEVDDPRLLAEQDFRVEVSVLDVDRFAGEVLKRPCTYWLCITEPSIVDTGMNTDDVTFNMSDQRIFNRLKSKRFLK